MAQNKRTPQNKRQRTRSSRKARKQSGARFIFLLLIIVFVAACAYKYKTDDDFRESVDGLRAEYIDKTLDTLGESAGGAADGTEEQADKAAQTQTPPDTGGNAAPGFVALPDGLELPVCAATRAPARPAHDHELRAFTHYTVCYRESYEQAEWSAYRLTRGQLVKNAGRTNDFRADPYITTDSASLEDYRGSGYDRGHLTPAADMSFDKAAMSETFFLSNMSPQAGAFNRGIWQQLEAQVRAWAQQYGHVYVVSGPVLEKPAGEYASIGANSIAVPEYYYKVVLAPRYADSDDESTPDDAADVAAIGFILPNDACKGKKFWDFAVPVAAVEARTGLDFFAALEDSTEYRAEAACDVEEWR